MAFHGQFGAQDLRDFQLEQRLVEFTDRRGILQRIPQAIDAAGELLPGLGEIIDEALVFVRLLEGWIDQDQPALLLRRQVCVQRQPAVEMGDARLEVAFEIGGKGK